LALIAVAKKAGSAYVAGKSVFVRLRDGEGFWLFVDIDLSKFSSKAVF